MARPITPRAGFNVSGVPVRIELDATAPRRMCAMEPCQNRAEVIFGARPHCLSCANEARAFLSGREGDAACLGVRV